MQYELDQVPSRSTPRSHIPVISVTWDRRRLPVAATDNGQIYLFADVRVFLSLLVFFAPS